MKPLRCISIAGVLGLVAILAGQAQAAPSPAGRPGQPGGGQIPQDPKQWNKGGTVRETAMNGAFTDFTVWPTDPQGNPIAGADSTGGTWPKTAKNVRHGESRDFVFPPGKIGGQDVADYFQKSRIHNRPNNKDGRLDAEFGTNWLYIESVYFDTQTNSYYMDGVFDLLHAMYGDNVFVHIPDLFADTNGSGGLDEADELYSLVDLRQFLPNPPDFGDNQAYTIVNGHVAGLPGMKFSTTPFSFSSSTGWDDGTPFTGEGVTYSYHSIESPEPAALSLLVLGCLMLRRRRS